MSLLFGCDNLVVLIVEEHENLWNAHGKGGTKSPINTPPQTSIRWYLDMLKAKDSTRALVNHGIFKTRVWLSSDPNLYS